MAFVTCVFSVVVLVLSSASAQTNNSVTIDQVMTAEELKSTGVASLSPSQREELNRWLNRYTAVLLVGHRSKSGECDPAIQSHIDGDFNGWEGETIYRLRNGQIWQQSSYHYHYHYAYAPEVTIYSSDLGCSMIVVGDHDQPISVRRLK